SLPDDRSRHRGCVDQLRGHRRAPKGPGGDDCACLAPESGGGAERSARSDLGEPPCRSSFLRAGFAAGGTPSGTGGEWDAGALRPAESRRSTAAGALAVSVSPARQADPEGERVYAPRWPEG